MANLFSSVEGWKLHKPKITLYTGFFFLVLTCNGRISLIFIPFVLIYSLYKNIPGPNLSTFGSSPLYKAKNLEEIYNDRCKKICINQHVLLPVSQTEVQTVKRIIFSLSHFFLKREHFFVKGYYILTQVKFLCSLDK